MSHDGATESPSRHLKLKFYVLLTFNQIQMSLGYLGILQHNRLQYQLQRSKNNKTSSADLLIPDAA
jgi:hypothetical protein